MKDAISDQLYLKLDNIGMLNNIFKPPPPRTTSYSPYFTNKQISEHAIKANNQHKYKKYKLLILLLFKSLRRVLSDTWDDMWTLTRTTKSALFKMAAFTEKNLNLSFFLAFDRIKQAATARKSDEKTLKNLVVLLERMQRYKLKQSFSKLVLNGTRTQQLMIATMMERRDFQFCRKLQTMVRRHKKEVLVAIGRYAKFVKSYSKVRVIGVIHNRFQRQLKHAVFARLSRFLIAKSSKTSVDREVRDLKTQLQDMTVQLQNKNQSIQRLEDEINQMKTEHSISFPHHNLSYGEPPLPKSKTGSFKSYSLKKYAPNAGSRGQLSQNESGDNLSINDMSIGSLLGNLNRSRVGSNSKYDPSCDCNCGFKTKYIKYKSLNQSLKNQLQIVKEELEVAKDLNEHFTNEIKQYLSGEVNEGDYQKLKKEQKLLLEERDQLREKVFKYQKHISNLKAEFKVKMEELYRKVRKDM